MKDFYLMYIIKTPFFLVNFKLQYKKQRNAKSEKMITLITYKNLLIVRALSAEESKKCCQRSSKAC